jgi:hypothetical protein
MIIRGPIVFTLLFVAVMRAASVCEIRCEADGVEYLVERARTLAEREYPRMVALLCERKRHAPKTFTIVFKSLPSRNTAETGGKPVTIAMNADYFARRRGQTNWVARHPETFDMVLLHEMAHVIQQYGRAKVPAFWAEGMADYARYRLGHTNGWSGPKCSEAYPDYKAGYHCAGAFLLYLDQQHGSNLVQRLNTELRGGKYSDAFFRKQTGRSLDGLWKEFRESTRFAPAAAQR